MKRQMNEICFNIAVNYPCNNLLFLKFIAYDCIVLVLVCYFVICCRILHLFHSVCWILWINLTAFYSCVVNLLKNNDWQWNKLIFSVLFKSLNWLQFVLIPISFHFISYPLKFLYFDGRWTVCVCVRFL